ncbi:Protein AH9.4 [Aphelenchoides avenae]|nr:Protein AH9.4 [Aphelenchus avenae]
MAAETFEQYGIYGDAPESTYRLLHQHEFDENETTERLAYPHDSLATDDFEDLLTQVSVCAGYVYVLLALVGILLNSYVIARLAQLAFSEYERFRGGCGLPLAAMSVSDLTSLCSIVSLVAFSSFVPPNVIGPSVYSAHCKLALYMINTMTGFSTWCWLFISARRYIAVYHPFWQISKADIGYGSLLAMLAVMLSLNSWLLISVVGQDHTCAAQRFLQLESPPSFARVAMLEKIRSRTYLFRTNSRRAQFSIRGVQDLLTGLREALRKPAKLAKADNTSETAFETPLGYIGSSVDHISINIDHAEPRDESVSFKIASPTPRRGRTAVRRWLAITTIHLLLNAPDNILRILTITDYSE